METAHITYSANQIKYMGICFKPSNLSTTLLPKLTRTFILILFSEALHHCSYFIGQPIWQTLSAFSIPGSSKSWTRQNCPPMICFPPTGKPLIQNSFLFHHCFLCTILIASIMSCFQMDTLTWMGTKPASTETQPLPLPDQQYPRPPIQDTRRPPKWSIRALLIAYVH